MYTLTVMNQKGGVGKSTTAHAIGAKLISLGKRVLFVDLDAQGNLTYTLDENGKGKTILSALQDIESTRNNITDLNEGSSLLASSVHLVNVESFLKGTGAEYRLKEALETLGTDYDYCIIDTPPALNILTINALTASNGAVIPAQADVFSLHGVLQIYSTIESIKKYCNKDLTILGLVLTRYNGRSVLTKDITTLLEETANKLNTKVYATKIRECIAIKEAQAVKQDIFSYAPRSNARVDYDSLISEILADIGGAQYGG